MFRSGSLGLALIQAAPASSGLPFRSESTVSMDRFVFAMLAVSLLLVAVIAALYVARKKGWFDGMAFRGSAAPGDRSGLSLRASRRVSAFTVVHVLARGDREFLVVESVRGATAQIHMMPSSQEGQESAP
ncbi:hypothetical protein ISN76_07730 [Dyella halodurans]|uniref:Flagellar protein n=1 Tax=Dyella halodurans TaxID=1920171 RepID=A0ABV9C457_9GAMM|nr:hypothetical protein [Dyella halodurans]